MIDESAKSRVAKFKVPVAGRKFTPWREIFKKTFSQPKTEEKQVKKLLEMVKKDNEKLDKLKSLGIDYTYPTYQDLLTN